MLINHNYYGIYFVDNPKISAVWQSIPSQLGKENRKFIIPIEVKSGTAKHARSLTQYCMRFNPEKSVLTSLDEMTQKILPLYAFWKFKDWVRQ